MFQPQDAISRCLIYNRFFPGNIHTDAVMLQFGKANKEDNVAHESGVARTLAPHDDDVHRIGCKIAAKQNFERGEPPPGATRKYYCGFRTTTYEQLAISDVGYVIEVKRKTEDGEPAHTDIGLRLLVTAKNERSTWRTAANLALADAFGPAVLYICESDLADNEHPLEKFGPENLFPDFVDRWPSMVLEAAKPQPALARIMRPLLKSDD